jgi:hypothetical protein
MGEDNDWRDPSSSACNKRRKRSGGDVLAANLSSWSGAAAAAWSLIGADDDDDDSKDHFPPPRAIVGRSRAGRFMERTTPLDHQLPDGCRKIVIDDDDRTVAALPGDSKA